MGLEQWWRTRTTDDVTKHLFIEEIVRRHGTTGAALLVADGWEE